MKGKKQDFWVSRAEKRKEKEGRKKQQRNGKKKERFSGQQKEECENRLIEPIKERKERQPEGWIFWGKRGRKGGSVFIIQGRKRP